MKFYNYLNEAKKINMKNLKNSLNSVYNLHPSSLKFEDGLLELVDNLKGINSEEKSKEILDKVESIIKKIGFEKISNVPKFVQKTGLEIKNVFISPKRDVLIVNAIEDISSAFFVYSYIYKLETFKERNRKYKQEIESLMKE